MIMQNVPLRERDMGSCYRLRAMTVARQARCSGANGAGDS